MDAPCALCPKPLDFSGDSSVWIDGIARSMYGSISVVHVLVVTSKCVRLPNALPKVNPHVQILF
jgi:hypothetical protein